MQRNETRSLSERRNSETLSSPEVVQPTQQIGPGAAGAKAQQFLQTLEAVSPGLQALAQDATERQREEAHSRGIAQAASDQMRGIAPEEVDRKAEEFNNPFFRDAYEAKRAQVHSDDMIQRAKKTIAKNQHKPGFNAQEVWDETLQEVMRNTPVEHHGEVAEKFGASHGAWRNSRREQEVKDAATKAKDTFLDDVDRTSRQLAESGLVPNEDVLESMTEDGQELNLSPREARSMALSTIGRTAVENANPDYLAELSDLRNDPELADEYMTYVEQAETARDAKLQVEEAEIRHDHLEAVENGTFNRRMLREIAEDHPEMYTEARAAQMLMRSEMANLEQNAASQSISLFLNDPTVFQANFGEEMSSDELAEVHEGALERLQERHPDSPDKAFKIWAERIADTGTGVPRALKNRMKVFSQIPQSSLADGEVPEEAMEAYNQYQMLRRGDIDGGHHLAQRILESSGMEGARENLELLDRFVRHGNHDVNKAYQLVQETNNRDVSAGELNTEDNRRELDRAVDDLDADVFGPESRGTVRQLARDYLKAGWDPEYAIDQAHERYLETHDKVRGTYVYHGGDTDWHNGLDEAVDFAIEDRIDDIRRIYGSDDVSPGQISVRQSPIDDGVLTITVEGNPVPGIRFDGAKLKEMYEQRISDQQQADAQAALESGRNREELLQRGREQGRPGPARAEAMRQQVKRNRQRLKEWEEIFEREDAEAGSTQWDMMGPEDQPENAEGVEAADGIRQKLRGIWDFVNSTHASRQREESSDQPAANPGLTEEELQAEPDEPETPNLTQNQVDQILDEPDVNEKIRLAKKFGMDEDMIASLGHVFR